MRHARAIGARGPSATRIRSKSVPRCRGWGWAARSDQRGRGKDGKVPPPGLTWAATAYVRYSRLLGPVACEREGSPTVLRLGHRHRCEVPSKCTVRTANGAARWGLQTRAMQIAGGEKKKAPWRWGPGVWCRTRGGLSSVRGFTAHGCSRVRYGLMRHARCL